MKCYILNVYVQVLLPPNIGRKPGLCYRQMSVRPSVRPLRSCMLSMQMAEDIVKLLSRPGSHTILVFCSQLPISNSKWNSFSGDAKYTDQIEQDNTCGNGRITTEVATSLPQGWGAPALPNFGVPFHLYYCFRTTKFDVVRGMCLLSHLERADFQRWDPFSLALAFVTCQWWLQGLLTGDSLRWLFVLIEMLLIFVIPNYNKGILLSWPLLESLQVFIMPPPHRVGHIVLMAVVSSILWITKSALGVCSSHDLQRAGYVLVLYCKLVNYILILSY